MKIFLSCVSNEFRSYRLKLANQLGALKGQPCEVKVQEDFGQGGFTLLDRLADYVRECDVVIHLVGDACGARPTPEHVRTMYVHLGWPVPDPLPDRSYTQWEYDLAVRFERRMLCYIAAPDTPRDCGPAAVAQPDLEARLQAEHRARIEHDGKHYETFTGLTDLARRVFYDLGLEASLKIDNLPYKTLGSLFKGRDAFLTQLRETLGAAEHRGHQRVAAITASATAAMVHGLGGIGKTRAAIEYARRYADDYTALLFVQADSPVSLQSNLASLCGPMVLNLAAQDATETEVQVAAVLDWLQRHPGWFLILDNVDTEESAKSVQAILARLSRAGQVVITSRLANWEGGVETLALDVLSVDAASEFLLERTAAGRRRQADDPDRARELAVDLGQLALALEQAGAYIVRHKCTFAGYQEEWRQRHDRVLEWFDERTMMYPRSVAITWQTSFDRLSEPARHLLRLLSWLAPDPIPESLLEAGGGPFAEAQDGDGTSDSVGTAVHDAGDALADLAAHSLVKRSDEEPTFSVHRLVQDVTRRGRPEDDGLPYLKQSLQWLDAAFLGNPEDVRTWPVLEPLAPHAAAVAAFAEQAGLPEPTAGLLNRLGALFYARAEYMQAERLFRRSQAIDEASYGAEHPNVAIRLSNLASLFQDTNRLSEAEPLMRRALAIDEASYGAEHPKVATDLNNLATLFQDTNRLSEAEPLMRRVVSIFEASLGPDHPNVATALNNLATLLQATNRLSEAEPLMRRALAIDEASYGAEHPSLARDLSNLATLLQATNRLSEAEPLKRRALAIDEASYGAEHPNVATALNNLAALLQATNRLSEAEPLMRRALAIDEASYGAEHPDVATDLNNLAQLLQATNRLWESEPLMRRALAIDEASYGAEHPDVATDLNNLAQLLQATNRLWESEPLMRRALAIDEASYGAEHPDVATDLNNLAQLLQATNRLWESEPLMRRALAIDEASYGAEHPNVATALNNLAALLQATNRLSEAEPLMRRAVEIRERGLVPGHPWTLGSMQSLAAILEALGRNDEGANWRRRRLTIIAEHPDQPPLALRTLALDAYKLGDYALAATLLERVLAAGFEPASTHCHLARLALLQADDAAAAHHADAAWENRASAEPYVVARILWLQVACALLAGASGDGSATPLVEVIGRLKTALSADGAVVEWAMDPVLAALAARLPAPDADLLRALVAAMSFPDRVDALDAFPLWRDAEPLPIPPAE